MRSVMHLLLATAAATAPPSGCSTASGGLRSWFCAAQFTLTDLHIEEDSFKLDVASLQCGRVWIGTVDSSTSTKGGANLAVSVKDVAFNWCGAPRSPAPPRPDRNVLTLSLIHI